MRSALLAAALLAVACSTPSRIKLYESADEQTRATFRKVGLPLAAGTPFFVSQGAFGQYSHNEAGNEYNWDLDVPYDTQVVAADAGLVIDVFEPGRGGDCDPKFNNDAHNVKIRHADGTVAQYVHVKSLVHAGQHVSRGEPIAVTAKNGWICTPQLHFGLYRNEAALYQSPKRQTVPVVFDGISGGVLHEGKGYKAQ